MRGAVVLLAAALAGCPNTDDPRIQFTPSIEPGRAYPLRGFVVFHEEPATLAQACGRPGLCGCVYMGVAHALLPRDWYDRERLEVTGHELLHVLGFGHPGAVAAQC